jgi:histidyl-tRNA synthetase
VIVGPDELSKQQFNLRDLATRQEQKGIPWAMLVDSVKSALSIGEGASG